MSDKSQLFAAHIMCMAAALEQLAYTAAANQHFDVVIKQLTYQKLILDELIVGGKDFNEDRIADILRDASKNLSEAENDIRDNSGYQ